MRVEQDASHLPTTFGFCANWTEAEESTQTVIPQPLAHLDLERLQAVHCKSIMHRDAIADVYYCGDSRLPLEIKNSRWRLLLK